MYDSYEMVRAHGLGDVLREHRRSRPHSLATIDGAIRLSYRELDQRVNRLVQAMAGLGIRQGDRILWVGQNSFRVLETLLAAAKIGAIFCPANWRMSAAETARVIEAYAPKLVFWQEAETGEATRQARKVATLPDCTWFQHDGEGTGSYEQLLSEMSDIDADERIGGDLPVLAVCTAAFDGYPKLALIPHSAIMFQCLTSAYGFAISERTVYLNSGPLFHLGTLNSTLAVFLFGGVNVFVRRVDATEVLQIIDRERVTHGFIPKPTIEEIRVLNTDGKYDVSSIWSTPTAVEWRHPQAMPANAPFTQHLGVYGQTETTGWAVMGWLGGSGGSRPSPMAQVRIVSDDGVECAPGEVGEITMRGPLVMNGYLDQAAENAARSVDGWHHTRDLGKRLDDGSIVFVGPKTVLIKSALENVYPAEVENCLREHAAVAEVCVIGIPDPVWSQNVKAVVVLKADCSVEHDELIEHCRQRIASYKKPKVIEFVALLPRSALGLVDRAAVDAAHGGGNYPRSHG